MNWTYHYHLHMETGGEGSIEMHTLTRHQIQNTAQDTKHYPPHLTLHS